MTRERRKGGKLKEKKKKRDTRPKAKDRGRRGGKTEREDGEKIELREGGEFKERPMKIKETEETKRKG